MIRIIDELIDSGRMTCRVVAAPVGQSGHVCARIHAVQRRAAVRLQVSLEMFEASLRSLRFLRCRSVHSFILGSYDKDDGPQLYMVDPSGISYVSPSHSLSLPSASCV